MDIKDIKTNDPQSFQMETVKAITELKGDIKNLTDVVKDLKEELKQRDETYVTITSHARDIQDVYQQIADTRKDLKDRIVIADKVHTELRQSAKAKAILWSVFTALITSVVIYEIMKAIK